MVGLLESFRVDTFCSGEAFSSGQNSEKSVTPSWWRLCPSRRMPPQPSASYLRPFWPPAATLRTLVATTLRWEWPT